MMAMMAIKIPSLKAKEKNNNVHIYAKRKIQLALKSLMRQHMCSIAISGKPKKNKSDVHIYIKRSFNLN